ncbi:MAG: hypothetical protein QOG66_2358 [Methylobacteriaceae bacterium]|jgi:uncharacterized protein (DUF2336 family)|nr:hypothetical protein [Methylobacteriaceae bacterium]
MLVRKFMLWVGDVSAAERAEGAGALARAYLYSDLAETEKRDAEVALFSLLDDPSPIVRKSIAEAFASALDAPHSIVLALANDQSAISSVVLGRSPLLSDAELIDCAAIGDAFAQAAIALRPVLSTGVAAALAEIGSREALIALAVNPGAEIADFSMRRMIERFGSDGEVREALLSRPHLPPALRSALVEATARALSQFVTSRSWLCAARAERVTRDARESANIMISAESARDCDYAGACELVAYLRQSGQLTAGLILRSLLSGHTTLFEAALCELSGMPAKRVAGLVRDFRGAGFSALYNRARLPAGLLPAFRAALEAQRETGFASESCHSVQLSRSIIERVLTACEDANEGALDGLLALLRRFEAEALREEARVLALDLRRPEQETNVVVPMVSAVPERFSAPMIDLDALEAEILQAA